MIANLLILCAHFFNEHQRSVRTAAIALFNAAIGGAVGFYIQAQQTVSGNLAVLLALLSLGGSIIATVGVTLLNNYLTRRAKREEDKKKEQDQHVSQTRQADSDRDKLDFEDRQEVREMQTLLRKEEREHYQRVNEYHIAQEVLVRARNHALGGELMRLQGICWKLLNSHIVNQIPAPEVNVVSEPFIEELKTIDSKLAMLAIAKSQLAENGEVLRRTIAEEHDRKT
jgi:hypothetical protein